MQSWNFIWQKDIRDTLTFDPKWRKFTQSVQIAPIILETNTCPPYSFVKIKIKGIIAIYCRINNLFRRKGKKFRSRIEIEGWWFLWLLRKDGSSTTTEIGISAHEKLSTTRCSILARVLIREGRIRKIRILKWGPLYQRINKISGLVRVFSHFSEICRKFLLDRKRSTTLIERFFGSGQGEFELFFLRNPREAR